jgi:hypothetical protein
MKLRFCQFIFLFILPFTAVFSQDTKYDLGKEDDKLSKHLIAREAIDLNNGDILVRNGEAFVDIFKQNQYPQQLIRISSTNEIKHIRNIKDTVIFKMGRFGGKPYLFFANATGKLKSVALNGNNLANESNATTLLQLSSQKEKPKKINDFIFPEIFFSKDSSKIAVLQPYIDQKKLAFNIYVFDEELRIMYKETVKTSFNSSYFFKLKSTLLTNDGKVFIAGTDNKNIFSIFSVNQNEIKKYRNSSSEDDKFLSYSDVLSSENDQPFFYTFSVTKKNILKSIKYTLLDDKLNILENKVDVIDLNYPTSFVGPFYNNKLVFKNFRTLSNGEKFLIAEYATPLPEPTLLGVLLIQKLNSGYIFSGPIVAIHLNNDMSLKSSKLITKFKRPNISFNGHHFFLNNDTAHFLFYDSPNNNIANLVDYQWNLESGLTSQSIIFKNKDLSKVKFDLKVGFSKSEKQVMLFGLLKKRVLLTFE